MSVVLKRKYNFKGNYTEDQKELLQYMIDTFRLRIGDDDPERNILYKKTCRYSDEKIKQLLDTAMNDINGGQPRTNYDIFEFNSICDNDLVVNGAIVFALLREGLLQVANQVDYSDSGLSIGMFNKTQLYQSWYSQLLQLYLNDKAEWKRAVLPKSENSGFYSVASEFSYYWWV